MILVSVSGGKDSTASLLLALEQDLPVRAVFADTGNEHPAVYDYVRYLADKTGVQIDWLKPDFSVQWWRRRDYVRDHWPTKGIDSAVVERTLAVFEQGPTGNPFLDLCMIKGRFPSGVAQFCTQYLKREPMEQYTIGLLKGCEFIESWQGVRADESLRRSKLPQRDVEFGQWEPEKKGLLIYRPILYWNVEQVFNQHRKHAIDPNPLYKQGMNRVGCMPCVNVAKNELLEISKRFPEHIDRIEEWERIVSQVAKGGMATFLFSQNDFENGNIRSKVEWSQTKHGGRLIDMFRQLEEPAMCQSSYGLCE